MKRIVKSAFILLLIFSVVVPSLFNFAVIPVQAQTTDPIPGLISEINMTNLINVSTTLVTQYGPRREDFYSPYIDNQCTLSTTIVYPKTTIEMSADYVKGLFEGMGYPASAITLEEVPQGAGHNVYVTKVGSVYPNVFIEFGAHMDTVVNSPGGSDNSSGSTAVIELARVLKDYPNRYSMRFNLWVGEEFSNERNAFAFGSTYHVEQALARGEQIKVGLNMDHIGQSRSSDPTDYVNGLSYNNAESERIADLFVSVTAQYGLGIEASKLGAIQNSDQWAYWDNGQIAVSSGGGSWFYNDPGYHNCLDTVSNISFGNTLRVAQQNLAVGVKLDMETIGVTSTPFMTSTNTLGPSPTSTQTPTITATSPTNTPGGLVGYPSTAVLDAFNRADGVLGGGWGGTTSGFSIASSRLDVGSGGAIFWQGGPYGADQEAYVTMTSIDPSGSEHDLLLKSQSSSGWTSGVLEVLYSASGNNVQVWTYSGAQGWVQRGTNLPVTFVNGDQFGARAKANGMVEIYRNGVLIGTRDASSWTYVTSGGYIGLWFINAANAVMDDFGGGTVATGPANTPTNTAVPPTATYTATAMPPTATYTTTSIPPTATYTATSVPPTATYTATSVPPTATYTATSVPLTATYTATSIPPTATYTATNTAVPPTATYTATSIPPTATYTPTNTAVPPTATYSATSVPPTATYTPTNTPVPSVNYILYVSSTTNGTAGGVSFADEDILSYNGASNAWSMYFDGSDVGITSDVDGFALLADGSILLSLDADGTVAGFATVDDSDIIRFIPTSLGPNTAGTFSWYFDGSDVGLTTNSEDIDSIGFTPDGKLVVSTIGSFSLTGASGNDEDLLVFTPTSLGTITAGSWEFYFDGSDVGLADSSSEEINGIWIDPTNNQLYLTTLGTFSVSGISGDGSDIFICTPQTLGSNTACTFASYWDGSLNGFSGEIIDGLHVVP